MHRERKPQSVTGIVAGPVLVLSVDVFLRAHRKMPTHCSFETNPSISQQESITPRVELVAPRLDQNQVGRSRLVSRTWLGQLDKPWDSAFITFSGY